MRVRIAYGVKMEDVPSKIRSLIEEAGMSLEEKLVNLKMISSIIEKQGGVHIAVQHIDQIRKSLADLDTILLDAHAIAEGFTRVLDSPEVLAEETPSAEEQSEAPSDVREG